MHPGLLVALVGSSAIMFMVLYLAHGVSVRTSTALAGTLFGLLVTAALGVVAIDAARLTGLGDESALNLRLNATELDFRGLLTCAVIVAGLGVLNDVTITQSSAVWELRSAAPGACRAHGSSPRACASAATTSPRRSTPSSSRTPVPRSPRSC